MMYEKYLKEASNAGKLEKAMESDLKDLIEEFLMDAENSGSFDDYENSQVNAALKKALGNLARRPPRV